MTFENEETVNDGAQADEGAGETTASEDTSSQTKEEQASSSSETQTPSVDWSQIDVEELYKARPELKPKSPEEIKAELLSSDEVKRQIQSEKDREIAKERRRLQQEAKLREQREAERKAADEKRRLLEEEDYESLGKLMADEEREAEKLLKSADIFKQTGEQWIRNNPEYLQLGEDRVDEILDSVKRRSGASFFDIQFELGRALADKKAEDAKAEAAKEIDVRVKEAVEAALAAAGVERRSQEAEEGQTASKGVTSGASPKVSGKARTWKESADLFNAGEISWEEHQPFHEQHKKEINK